MPARELVPFQPMPHLQGLELLAAADREAEGRLRLRFSLSGPLQAVLLPALSPEPIRRDGLWESTCFEAFLGQQGAPNYWEINLAPNGDWNLYALSDYRTGLKPETRVNRLPFSQSRRLKTPDDPSTLERLDLELILDLSDWIGAEVPLELSATAVLEHRNLGCSYWAWHHTGSEADFHRRDSFQPI